MFETAFYRDHNRVLGFDWERRVSSRLYRTRDPDTILYSPLANHDNFLDDSGDEDEDLTADQDVVLGQLNIWSIDAPQGRAGLAPNQGDIVRLRFQFTEWAKYGNVQVSEKIDWFYRFSATNRDNMDRSNNSATSSKVFGITRIRVHKCVTHSLKHGWQSGFPGKAKITSDLKSCGRCYVSRWFRIIGPVHTNRYVQLAGPEGVPGDNRMGAPATTPLTQNLRPLALDNFTANTITPRSARKGQENIAFTISGAQLSTGGNNVGRMVYIVQQTTGIWDAVRSILEFNATNYQPAAITGTITVPNVPQIRTGVHTVKVLIGDRAFTVPETFRVDPPPP